MGKEQMSNQKELLTPEQILNKVHDLNPCKTCELANHFTLACGYTHRGLQDCPATRLFKAGFNEASALKDAEWQGKVQEIFKELEVLIGNALTDESGDYYELSEQDYLNLKSNYGDK